MSVYSETLSVASWNTVSVTSRTTGGWSDGEDAIEREGDNFVNDGKSYLGTLGDDTVLYNDANGGGGLFNGGSYWHIDETNTYVMVVNGSGVVSSYTAVANIIPKAPTSVSAGSATTSTITVSWTNVSAIDDEIWIYYVKNGSNSADSGDTSWGDNPLSNSTTSDIITGLDVDADYSFVVYAKNGTSLSAAGSGNRDTEPTIENRAIATSAGTTTTDQWTSEIDAYKYSEGVVLTLTNTQSNDQMLITATHSGATPVNLTLKMGANKTNGTAPYASNGAAPGGTGGQETSNITSTATLTFSSLSSGTNYFTVMMEGLSDHAWGSAFGTTTFTISALVKDSGGSTVLASANFFTWLASEFTD